MYTAVQRGAQQEITVQIRVNRNRTPMEAVVATGRSEIQLQDEVVKAMPRNDAEEVVVHFFKLGRWASPSEVAHEYEQHGLKPDPYAQAAVNEQNPEFATQFPNASQWEDEDFTSYRFVFILDGGPNVGVYCHGGAWEPFWWFAGVK
jgi:hypothetical protein